MIYPRSESVVTLLLLLFFSLPHRLYSAPPNEKGYAVIIPDSLRDSSTVVRVEYLSNRGYEYVGSAPDTALMIFKQAELLARNENDSTALLKAIFDLGHVMMARGIYEQALDYMFTGEQLSAAIGDVGKNIFFLFWKSRVYNELGEYEKSVNACETAMALNKGSNRGWALNYYGEALRGTGRLEAARDSLLVAMKVFEEEREGIGRMMVAAKIAHVSRQLGQPDEVRKYGNYVLKNWERMWAYESMLTASKSAVEMHLELGELDSAEHKAVYALEKAEGKMYYRPMTQLMQLLASVYEKKGDPGSALRYARMAAELSDKYELDKVKINLAVRDAEFTNERLRAYNDLLQAQKRGQVYLMLGLGAVLLLLLVGGVLLFRANRRSRDLNKTLRNKNKDLDELNQEKDMLMQIVAHDLKSPLNNVKGLSEMLKVLGELNEAQLGVLGKMDFVVNRGIDLIKNLLELSALEHGNMQARSVDSQLSETLQKVIADYRTLAEKKSISLHLDLPPEPILLRTDPSHYERIVDNLVSNAIKYSPKGMRVWVELKKNENHVYTVVRDEGPGIGKEEQQKLFRKFQRLSARPTGGESSNGLGLAIVKAFADQIGGEIKVNSALGKGAEFILALPVTA